jgi:hypothetical protein
MPNSATMTLEADRVAQAFRYEAAAGSRYGE